MLLCVLVLMRAERVDWQGQSGSRELTRRGLRGSQVVVVVEGRDDGTRETGKAEELLHSIADGLTG